MRTVGRSPDIVNQNTLPSQPQRPEAGPVVLIVQDTTDLDVTKFPIDDSRCVNTGQRLNMP